MSNKLRAAAQAAYRAMVAMELSDGSKREWDAAVDGLKAALAEPAIKESLTVAEPVAWMSDSDVGFYKEEFGMYPCVPLYTAPPSREWVGLTDGEILEMFGVVGTSGSDINPRGLLKDTRRIEAKLKEKNT